MRVFISHASEDKAEVARPLAERLAAQGIKVWYDEFTLTLGDSLTREIDRGLTQCDFGVVILSPSFFGKEWPRRELEALHSRETIEGRKRILPVWHQLEAAEVAGHSPLLASRLAVSTHRGLDTVVDDILAAVRRSPAVDLPPVAPQSSMSRTAWPIGATVPSFGCGEDGRGGLLFHFKATFVNRSPRAAVLSFQLRYELEHGDPRKWVAIPEGRTHESERVRVDAESFVTKELHFHFVDVSTYGGADAIRKRRARLWITDHISQQQALIDVPTPR